MRVLIFLSALILSFSARADTGVFPLRIVIACAPEADALRDVLSRRHGEAVVLQGTMPAGQRVEIWASPDGASWTITAAMPSGALCILSGGSDLRVVPPPPAEIPGEKT